MNSSLVSGFDHTKNITELLVDGALVIDNTTLESFLTCARKGFLQRIRRRLPDKPRPALDFGSAVHKALEYRYTVAGNTDPSAEVKSEMIRLAKEELLTKGIPMDYRNEDYLEHVITSYNANYGDEPFDIIRTANDVPLVEAPFAIEIGVVHHSHPNLPNPLRVIWTGKIDMCIVWPNASKATFDHKTSAMSGAYYFQEYSLSQPQIGYVYAARQQLDPTIDRFVINALFCRKPAASGKINLEFQREQIYVTDEMIEEWKQNTLNAIGVIIEQDLRGYPASFKSCISKYGPCQYFDLCTVSRGQREQVLSSNVYIDDKWSPLSE